MDVSLWKKHRYEFTVKPEYLDGLGHMNNVAYFRVYEDARWAMISERGFGVEAMERLQQGPVVLRIEIDFLREVKAGRPYWIESSNLSYEGKVQKVLQEIKSEEIGVHARAVFTMGLFDMKARKLVLPSEDWLRASGKPGEPQR